MIIPAAILHSLVWNRSSQLPIRCLLCGVKRVLIVHLSRRTFYITGDVLPHGTRSGIDQMDNNRINKGLAFTMEERFALGIHGLQPIRVKTQEEQVEVCKRRLNLYKNDLNKYLYLMDLHSRNERLFFRVLTENLHELLPIVYTPTVALACLQFGLFYRRMKALYVTIHDKGRIYELVKNWPESDVRASVVTDGERILGLGDLGVQGVCICVGKMGLYTALAGVKPHVCMPAILDVGTNNTKLLEDPLYLGVRQKRLSGPEYDAFVDEFMEAVIKRFGHTTVIQFEDFGNSNAFRYLEKYRNRYCVFNDDIQGTAGAAVAGLFAAQRILKKKFKDHIYLFLGAGEAAVGIADLSVKHMMEKEGVSLEDARSKIWMHDIHGLLTKGRPEGLEERQSVYAKEHAPSKSFAETVRLVKPTVLIGVSTVGNTFTAEILKDLATFSERPIIFALSNPNMKAECTPADAYKFTNGRALYASGSPFSEVEFNGKIIVPGQGNNAYIYPGVALGAIISGIHHISDDIIMLTAHCVAALVTEENLKNGTLYPALSNIMDISVNIAAEIFQYACDKGISSVYPEPSDKKAYIRAQLYDINYPSAVPTKWSCSEAPGVKVNKLEPVKLAKRKG